MIHEKEKKERKHTYTHTHTHTIMVFYKKEMAMVGGRREALFCWVDVYVTGDEGGK